MTQQLNINYWSTDQAATFLHIKPESMRVRLCRTGSFHGVRPKKTPSRFLLWPVAEIIALVEESKV
jgi:hypothetical protein